MGVAAPALAHGSGLNACGCHFNRKTAECRCHQPRACGCESQPPGCAGKVGIEGLGVREAPGPEQPEISAQPRAPMADTEPELLTGGCGVERWKVKPLSRRMGAAP